MNRMALLDDAGLASTGSNASEGVATDRAFQSLMPRWRAADGVLRTRVVLRDLVLAVAHLAARERDAAAARV